MTDHSDSLRMTQLWKLEGNIKDIEVFGNFIIGWMSSESQSIVFLIENGQKPEILGEVPGIPA